MKKTLFFLAALAASAAAGAQNPIVSTSYTPDPAPYVHGDTVYVFTGHDEDDATYFKMKDWQLFSTTDMVNWTYLGTPISTATFPWAEQGDNAWASQAVERGGKWYWYVCVMDSASHTNALAVAVADHPQGPWRDAIGGPLARGFGFIDPTVFVDDDGTAWLVWGNKGCWIGRLNDDMISFADGYKEMPGFHDPAAFGPESMKMNWAKGKEEMMVGYEEGPWLYKRDGTYYLSYPSGGVPEHMAYSTAPSPEGPWTYRGRIMDESKGSFTIHGGNIDYRGHHYMFYHSGTLPNGGGFHRSACVEEFEFGEDGTIPFIPFTKGVRPVGTLNPYERVEAETMASSWGLKTDRHPGRRHYVTSVHNGDWLRVRSVDFGEASPVLAVAEVLNFKNPGTIEFYLDNLGGRPLATLDIKGENAVVTAPAHGKATGTHDVCILFRGGDGELFDVDWWKFCDHVNRPLVQTRYTADPAPMVYKGRVYLYTTHDEDYANGFEMYDWLLYSSTDMVNWTDHGPVASTKDFAWRSRDNGAWALQVVERNGKFYMYCPLHGHGIGVLVADRPEGPFTDPLGHPLVWQQEHWDDIDPTVFIDKDGQAYMYWGNPNLYMVRLNKDMISYSGEIEKLPHIEDYQEGPWFWRRDNHYYLAFASTCCPEGIGYAMSDAPTGPWQYKGHIMNHTQRTRGNHPGIIDYKGKSYVFGLNYDLMHEETFIHHERRSVSAAEMHYLPDGSIEEVPYWQDATLEQVEAFNPYRKVEAETMAWGYGLKTVRDADRGMVVTNISEGKYIQLRGVDFGKGAKKFTACLTAASEGAIEIHLDAPGGPLAGTLTVSPTAHTWKETSCAITDAKGLHDLFFVFKGNCDMQWDWWKFSK